MTDHSELSFQSWELNYILAKFGKKESENNRTILRNHEKEFKSKHGGSQTKSYTKDEFYEYLSKVKPKLEDR